jgi:hypothetical protein
MKRITITKLIRFQVFIEVSVHNVVGRRWFEEKYCPSLQDKGGGNRFHHNVGNNLPNHMTLHPRKL